MLVCIGLTLAQKPSYEAAIIKESRYLNTAGQFGASYSQEDGVEFSEEADAEGNRKGSYTYIDPNGQRKTVHYTAGRDGFQATGDHLPVAPQVPPSPFPVPGLPQANEAVTYNAPIPQNIPSQPNSLQVQYQSLPIPGSPLLSLFQIQPISIISSTETPISVPSRHYPPGKLNVKQTADGFSYTFNSLV